MCGICGKLYFKDITPRKEFISAMCNKIVYRGPDDEGVYVAPHIGLGQRRLSIIDLQTSACPPLSNEDESIWISFNGEIYNFQEIRKTLQEKGHVFKTKSDTEVIIHLYEEKGVECLQQFRGMFAFALWDSRKKILFCARDRMGKKPLSYFINESMLVFGSEIKSITVDPEVPVAPNYHAIDQYLTYQFVPSPVTAFKGIRKLGAGEYFICDIQGNLEVRKYWEPTVAKKTTASEVEIQHELLEKLTESVKLRMISDVPLGAFLSGGIDSATVVALMAGASSTPVKTFSIGFEEDAFNELPYARLIAQRYGTCHYEMVVKPNASEVLPLLVQHYNEPFADSSALPTYYVSKMTRQHVTVALSGDGGDESFAGYANYATLQQWNRWNYYPGWTRAVVAGSAYRALGLLPYNNAIARWKRGLEMITASDIKERRLLFGTILKKDEKRALYSLEFRKLIEADKFSPDRLAIYPWSAGMDDLDWLMRHDQNFYLPDCLMVKSDIASMANSLEVRSPFLDHTLVEFAAEIPSKYKRNTNGGKIILRNAVKHLLPQEILQKRKTGFGMPVAKWLRTDLAPMMKEILLSDKARHRGLFDYGFLTKIISDHIAGKRDWSTRLWALLFLELWFIEFID